MNNIRKITLLEAGKYTLKQQGIYTFLLISQQHKNISNGSHWQEECNVFNLRTSVFLNWFYSCIM